MHRRLVRLTAAAAAAAVLPFVATGVQPARAAVATSHVLYDIQIQGTTLCPESSTFPQAYGGAAVGDIYGNGGREVVAAFPNGGIYAYNATTGAVAPGWPESTGGAISGSPTLADLYHNGQLEVIVASSDGTVDVFGPNGNLIWKRHTLFGTGGIQSGFFSSVAVGDINGDGRMVLFASALDQHTYAWTVNGDPLPGWPKLIYDSALATPTLADLEHRHQLAIVTPSDATHNSAVVSWHDGGKYWAWRPDGSAIGGLSNVNTNEVPWASPAIDDLQGNGVYSVVNGTGNYYGQTTHNPAIGAFVSAFRVDGSSSPGFPVNTGAENFASPAVGDIYGNGGREVVETSGNGTTYAWGATGNPLFAITSANPVSSGGPAIAPVDGSGHNGVWVNQGGQLVGYSVAGGVPTPVHNFDISENGTRLMYSTPTIAPVPTLGHMIAVATSERGTPGCGGTQTFHINAWSLDNTSATMPAGAWPTFHGNMQRTGSNLPLSPPPPPAAHGYWMVARDGGIFPFGNAPGYGSTGNIRLNQPIVGMARTPTGNGYWLVAADGGIFPFGGAPGWGSTGNIRLNKPIVGMAAAPGGGYWLVASDGGIFPFGPGARGYGSTGNIHLNQPIVGMAATPDGGGYWLVASDGGIFPFGNAQGYGSTGNIRLNKPIVGMATAPQGYWLVATDGGIFPFGPRAPGYGSTGNIALNQPIVGMAATVDGGGYWLVASDGGIFPFGNAPGYGSTGNIVLNQPMVGIANSS